MKDINKLFIINVTINVLKVDIKVGNIETIDQLVRYLYFYLLYSLLWFGNDEKNLLDLVFPRQL